MKMASTLLWLFLWLWLVFTYSAASIDQIGKGFLRKAENQTAIKWQNFQPFLASGNGKFALGFLKTKPDRYLLAIFCVMAKTSGEILVETPPTLEMVWSVNRNKPINGDGYLEFTEDGLLSLRDGDREEVWSATAEAKVVDMIRLSSSGNLLLLGSGKTVWESFSSPTDTLLVGQNFTAEMRLIAAESDSDPSEGTFFAQMSYNSMALMTTLSSPPQAYWKLYVLEESANILAGEGPIYSRMMEEGYLGMYQTEQRRVSFTPFSTLNDQAGNLTRRLKIESDGNLKVYYWQELHGSWVLDYKGIHLTCGLPSVCGSYGICNSDGSCSCPSLPSLSFIPINTSNVNEGCDPPQPLRSCPTARDSFFVEISQVDYVFNDFADNISKRVSDVSECEALCENSCTCAAFFYNKASGLCSLAMQPLMSLAKSVNPVRLAFLRVQNSTYQSTEDPTLSEQHSFTVAISLSLALLLFILALSLFGFRKWQNRSNKSHQQDLEKLSLRQDSSIRSDNCSISANNPSNKL